MIRVENLTYAYGNRQAPALKNINVAITEGEWLALIGPNGSGKSTLIRHFNALLLPTAGQVEVDNLNTRVGSNLIEIRRRVGMVFQNPDNQIVGMSVEEDVAFGPGNLGLPSSEVRRRVTEALETVGLNGLEKRIPHTLSGGQKQLLALAGLLAMEPGFIILDEPTSSLDPASKDSVLELLHNLKSKRIGIVQVTHTMDEAALADRVLVMNQGELVADGVPREILNRVDWLKSMGLAPPLLAELMWRLNQGSSSLGKGILTLNEAVEEINTMLRWQQADSTINKPRKVERYV